MIIKLEHIALMAADMDESILFYQSFFGFQLRARGYNQVREMAFLYLPNHPEVEIELMRDIEPLGPYSEKGFVNHLAFTVENIDSAAMEFRKKGIVFNTEHPNTAIDGAKTIFFHGPNRELLQLVQPAKQYKKAP